MSENAVIPFQFENHNVRVMDRDGEPWFVLADVCRVLEIGNPSDAGRRLDEDERMTLDLVEGHSGRRGGARKLNIINESGLYALILTSDKPEAKRFRKWVTAEVIPAIRKTGEYRAPGKSPDRLDEDEKDDVQVMDTIRRQQVAAAFIQRNFAPFKIRDLSGESTFHFLMRASRSSRLRTTKRTKSVRFEVRGQASNSAVVLLAVCSG